MILLSHSDKNFDFSEIFYFCSDDNQMIIKTVKISLIFKLSKALRPEQKVISLGTFNLVRFTYLHILIVPTLYKINYLFRVSQGNEICMLRFILNCKEIFKLFCDLL